MSPRSRPKPSFLRTSWPIWPDWKENHPPSCPIHLLKVEGDTVSWKETQSPSTLSPSTSLSKHQKTWLDEQLHMVYSSKSKWAFYSLCPKLQSHSISLQALRSLCRSTLQALHSTHRTVRRRSKPQRTEKVQTAEPLQIFYSLLQD